MNFLILGDIMGASGREALSKKNPGGTMEFVYIEFVSIQYCGEFVPSVQTSGRDL